MDMEGKRSSGLVACFRHGSEVKVGKEKRRRRMRGSTQARSLALGFFSFVEVEVDKRVVYRNAQEYSKKDREG